MNNSELILKILRGESVDKVVWAPRLEQWFEVNAYQKTLPVEFRNSDFLEICDKLGIASPRTYYFFEESIRMVQQGDVEVRVTEDGEKIVSTYSTPRGKLYEVKKSIHGLASFAVAPSCRSSQG